MRRDEVKSAFLAASNKLHTAYSHIRNHRLRHALRVIMVLKAVLLSVWTFFVEYSGFGAIWVKTAGFAVEALLILSPFAIYPYIMMKPPPLCYVFFVLWIVSWLGLTVLVAAMEYTRDYRRNV